MILGIIAYDQAAIQCMLNAVVPHGGYNEIRLLEMGETSYFKNIIIEAKMVHNVSKIDCGDLHSLFNKDSKSPEIIVVLTGTKQSLVQHMDFTHSLMTCIVQEITVVKPASLKFVFGDNIRGLFQQVYFEKLLAKSDTEVEVEAVTLCSIYQMSKVLDSSLDGRQLRCYPKANGSLYFFDPSTDVPIMTDLGKEADDKLKELAQLFEKKNCDNYPNVEATIISRFLKAFAQSDDWEGSLRSEELHSRNPQRSEIEYYGLENGVPMFLPSLGDEEADRLPELVKKHVKNISELVKSTVVVD